jgi:hypothetical protein
MAISLTNSARKVRLALLLTGILLVSPAAHAQKNVVGMADREQERRSLAINLVRAIIAAETNYKKNYGVYTTWENLLGNGDFSDTGTKWAPESLPAVAHATYGRGPEIVPGWKLRLSVSKEGAAYDLLLEDVSDPKCGYAVGSDERGQLRQGKYVSCAP